MTADPIVTYVPGLGQPAPPPRDPYPVHQLDAGVTPNAMPYPGTADKLAQSAAYLRNLAAAATTYLGTPPTAYWSGTVTTDVNGRFAATFGTMVVRGMLIMSMDAGRPALFAYATRVDPTIYIWVYRPSDRGAMANTALPVMMLGWS